jgi:PKD domain
VGLGLVGGQAPRRGLSSGMGVAILVITVVVLAGVSYFVFNSSPVSASCVPAHQVLCGPINVHDVSILASFTIAQQGQLIPFTAVLSPGEVATQFKFNFGDGRTVTGATATAAHAYRGPGTYMVCAQALVGGVWHDNLWGLLTVNILASYARDALGTEPGVTGTLTANSSGRANPTTVLAPGG